MAGHTDQGPQLRVHVYYRVTERQSCPFQADYERALAGLRGTAGLLRTELLIPYQDPAARVLVMHWTGDDAFGGWERDQRARGHPSPLRGYQDRNRPGGHYELYACRTRPCSDHTGGRP